MGQNESKDVGSDSRAAAQKFGEKIKEAAGGVADGVNALQGDNPDEPDTPTTTTILITTKTVEIGDD